MLPQRFKTINEEETSKLKSTTQLLKKKVRNHIKYKMGKSDTKLKKGNTEKEHRNTKRNKKTLIQIETVTKRTKYMKMKT